MVSPPRHGISLCAGGGGLDMGLGLAEPGFGTACFVEIEEYPRSVIAAAQAAGYFHPAPIWDDLKRFSGRPWRGICDTILAGYPCQPFSAAGQRQGDKDPRHLWPDVARIIGEVQPEWVFLENVPGHVTLGLETVLRKLWDMGFTPAVGLFSAGEVGAPHERLRIFIVAHRNGAQLRTDSGRPDAGTDGRHDIGGRCRIAGAVDNPQRIGRNTGRHRNHRSDVGQQPGPECRAMGHTAGVGCREGRAAPSLRGGRDTFASAGGAMADATGSDGERAGRQPAGRTGPANDGRYLADAGSCGSGKGPGPCGKAGPTKSRAWGWGWFELGDGGGNLADASGTGSQGQQQGEHHPGEWQDSVGPAGSPGGTGLFPPGPSDTAAWADTLAAAPDMAPAAGLADCLAWAGRLAQTLGQQDEGAAQSRLCGMADGLATRARQLRLLGNGVVPLAAGYAWRTLSAAHGLRPVDLDAASGAEGMDAV